MTPDPTLPEALRPGDHGDHTIVPLVGGAGHLTIFDHMALLTFQIAVPPLDAAVESVMLSSGDAERLRERFRPGPPRPGPPRRMVFEHSETPKCRVIGCRPA